MNHEPTLRWTFLPKALLIQFLRVSNIYFLITAIISFIPGFSPLPGYSSALPLAFVLLMSMAREGYEDIVSFIKLTKIETPQDRQVDQQQEMFGPQTDPLSKEAKPSEPRGGS